MNFIWLKSHSGEVSDFPRHPKGMIAVDFGEDPASVAPRYRCAAIVVEVQDSIDVQRAVEILDELREAYPVWIYQRSATIKSTLSFMKAGASHVMTQPD